MEMLEIIDIKGNNTGKKIEREKVHDLNLIHNEVTIYIINNKGQVLLQKRSMKRRFCPGKLGVIAGHVNYHETVEEAAIRELKEEINLIIPKEKLHPLCDRYYVSEDNNNHFMYPFYVISNLNEEDFKIQKEELTLVKWYDINDVIKMIQDNDSSVVFKISEIEILNKLKGII